MDQHWEALYLAAKKALNPRVVSKFVEAGGVAAAVETVSGKIYVGVCVDTVCTLGICAERNAIFHMLSEGECEIRRVLAVGRRGNIMPPCGACRELMTQLMPERYGEIEIMVDLENETVVSLAALTPSWWI